MSSVWSFYTKKTEKGLQQHVTQETYAKSNLKSYTVHFLVQKMLDSYTILLTFVLTIINKIMEV